MTNDLRFKVIVNDDLALQILFVFTRHFLKKTIFLDTAISQRKHHSIYM